MAGGLSSYDNRLEFFMNNQELFPNLTERGEQLEQAFAEFNEEAFEMLFPDPKRTENRSVRWAEAYLPRGCRRRFGSQWLCCLCVGA